MKYLAALVLFPTAVFSQVIAHEVGNGQSVCPLSDSQTAASIAAFDKIYPVLTEEPRCLNCHGGVDPFIDGVGNPSDPAASRTEHGGGKMDAATATSKGSDCSSCHGTLAPMRDGLPSTWAVPPAELFFTGKEASTLCAQLHRELARPGDLVGHLQDDRGADNFVGTAFLGMRGLSAEQFPEIAAAPPRAIDRDGLVELGTAWLATTAGEFQGDETHACGCEPLHYAVRVSAATQLQSAGIQFKSTMAPADIPIAFADDGSFSGEGVVNFAGESAVRSCSAQYASTLQIRASGKLRNNAGGREMSLRLEDLGPAVNSVSAQCLNSGFVRPNVQSANTPRTVMNFAMVGNVGEFLEYQVPGLGVSSQLHVEIVQLSGAQ